jgi:hypothetical protein
MDRLEKNGNLVQDANEGRWIVDSLQRIVNRDAPQEVKTRAEGLIKAINQRLMSQYPLGTRTPMSEEPLWQELDEAGYMRTPIQETHDEQKQDQPQNNEDDEMAATAGRLLERVADNTSEKFQNSQFLELMRRLRDREVRVQEDKIVEVDGATTTTTNTTTAPSGGIQVQPTPQTHSQSQQSQSHSQIPSIDPTILSHAATDFNTPIYSDQDLDHDQEQYAHRPSSPPPPQPTELTYDEISDQYRYYNIHAAYHNNNNNNNINSAT